MSGIELASLVRQLRAELSEALAESQGERLRFELGPIELTLTLTVGREAVPGAKIRFWVIEAGTEARISREAIQEIKLVLSPRDMEVEPGPDGRLSSALIGGRKLPGER
jgi:hypothetical protein